MYMLSNYNRTSWIGFHQDRRFGQLQNNNIQCCNGLKLQDVMLESHGVAPLLGFGPFLGSQLQNNLSSEWYRFSAVIVMS